MAKLRSLSALLLTLPALASAQSGTVHYSRAVKHNFNLPPGITEEMRARLPTAAVTPMVLRFTPAASVLSVAPATAPAGADATRMAVEGGMVRAEMVAAMGAATTMPRGDVMVTRVMTGSNSRADFENLVGAHTDLESGAQLQSYRFLTRPFLVSGERPAIAWKLTTEQSVFLNYPVLKATATHEGKEIEAWFTPQIPVSAGPGEFGGLPGLILTVTVDGGQVTWAATAVDLAAPVGDLAKPTDGQKVSRAEYEKIVDEKLVEMRQQGAARRVERIP